jgi:hypothetical protein
MILLTTTIRISKKTKARLERVSSPSGLNNLSKTLDFAVDAAEDKLNQYRGNVKSVLKFKGARSGFSDTSERVWMNCWQKSFAREKGELLPRHCGKEVGRAYFDDVEASSSATPAFFFFVVVDSPSST